MTLLNDNGRGTEIEKKLPRRDLWLLPLLSLLTVIFLLATGELTARHFYTSGGNEACAVNDNTIGYRYRPFCVARTKSTEGPWVTYNYNDCGYRTKESCRPKPPGVARIALLGSSMSFGLNVPYDDTFAQRTADRLTQALSKRVEVQNLSRPNTSVIGTFHQVDEALALKPDLLLLQISPYDIERINPDDLPNRYKPISPEQYFAVDQKPPNALQRVKGLVNGSSLGTAAQHFYYQDSANFALMYLHYGDRADYLRQPFTPAWESRFQALDVILTEIKAKCDAASVSFVVVELPTFAQAALLKMNDLPAGVDPYALGRRLGEITHSHHIELIDTLDNFKQGPSTNQVFYVLDGHINADGHALVADAIVKQLVEDQRNVLLENDALRPVRKQEQ